MKLTYITPASRVINLAPMQMLAASNRTVTIVNDESKALDPSTSFSESKGWSSDNWTAADED